MKVFSFVVSLAAMVTAQMCPAKEKCYQKCQAFGDEVFDRCMKQGRGSMISYIYFLPTSFLAWIRIKWTIQKVTIPLIAQIKQIMNSKDVMSNRNVFKIYTVHHQFLSPSFLSSPSFFARFWCPRKCKKWKLTEFDT